ncbi:PaaI family thioesterase [Ramlibacter albus]|uniref:PaaI family thioesterase n=1 Tax=Ramlibacter albus TaxID=2079448 RepID=A0A923S4R7_9BURK|nr:PaaI family thioesterase [Ramlibacter albus]MBC5764407.1 PaaI family thioesterase [Ramlibacter albus]
MASKTFGVTIPFVHHLGFEMVEMKDGHSHLEWAPKPEHMNSFEVTHGGGVMTFLDVIMATAARSVEESMGVVTIEMKTTFMRPAVGQLTGRGRVMHRTRSMAFCEGAIHDANGDVCAHATGTFKYVARRTDRISTD